MLSKVSLSLKAFLVLISWDNLKAAKAKFQSENNMQESTSLSCKTEVKIYANPGHGLAWPYFEQPVPEQLY